MATTKTDRLMDIALPYMEKMNKEDLEELSERINNDIDSLIMTL